MVNRCSCLFPALLSIPLLMTPAIGWAAAWQTVSSCVQYLQYTPYVHIVKTDLSCPQVQLIGTDERMQGATTSQFAEATGAVVAVNANFFDLKTKRPFGLVMTNGRIWSGVRDSESRVFLACTKFNRCTVDAVDTVVEIRSDWHTVISGWQVYRDGQFLCPYAAKRDCWEDNAEKMHPRTVVGLDISGAVIYFIVVEGRRKLFPGISLISLGEIFKQFGVVEGINLDGGGSSELVINGKRITRLPDNQIKEREVANHFGIRLKALAGIEE